MGESYTSMLLQKALVNKYHHILFIIHKNNKFSQTIDFIRRHVGHWCPHSLCTTSTMMILSIYIDATNKITPQRRFPICFDFVGQKGEKQNLQSSSNSFAFASFTGFALNWKMANGELGNWTYWEMEEYTKTNLTDVMQAVRKVKD